MESIIYSDGNVEERICEYLKSRNGSCESIIEDLPEGAVFHNFSSARENLLKWYPFKKDSSVLEVGAGMGALTPFLASVCERVVALEPSAASAAIIRERCKDKQNIQVVAQSLDMYAGQEGAFDYVTLIGVLDYAGVYGESENPWREMLCKARRFLKPDGKLLLAIENKFGLKYWCGAAEDHTGVPFDSLNNYSKSKGSTGRYAGNKGVRTFSKAELNDLLVESGFEKSTFYYALPDYKFPMLMLTDQSEAADVLVGDVKFTYPEESTLIADELKLYPEIIRNRALGFFANSFFIEASGAAVEACDVVTVTMKRDYKAKHRILTRIGENTVERAAMNPESEEHIAALISNTQFLQECGIPCVSQEPSGSGKTKARKVTAPRADDVFARAVRDGDVTLATQMLEKLRMYLLMSSESSEQNGETVLKTGYIDLTFRNSFWQDGDLLFFDQEWVGENIPLRYILYRAIRYAMNWLSEEEQRFYYDSCGITPSHLAMYAAEENRFLCERMDEQNCRWFDRAMYSCDLELESAVARELSCKEGHIEQLLQSERDLQTDVKCKESHIEQLLQSERDLQADVKYKENHIEQLLQSERDLLTENSKKESRIFGLEYEVGYHAGVAKELQRTQGELIKQLKEARDKIDRLQRALGTSAGKDTGLS